MLCSQVNAVGKLTRCCFIFSTAVRQDKSDRELTGESCKMRFAETGFDPAGFEAESNSGC